MKFVIWRDCITNDAYTILFSKREGGMVFNFQQSNILEISRRSVYWRRESEYPVKTIDLPQVTDELYHVLLYLVYFATGAWGMDFVSSSPLFSTTPPFFSKFSYKSFLFQNFHNHSFFLHLTISVDVIQSKKCGHRIHVLFMMYDVY